MITFSNLKTYWAGNTFSVVISNIFGKKPEYYCNISVRTINGTAKNTGSPRPLRFENVP
jgi:hypothetical protein